MLVTFLKNYKEVLIAIFVISAMKMADVQYKYFYIVLICFLVFLLGIVAFSKKLPNIRFQFVLLSVAMAFLLPLYPPDVNYYYVSGKLIAKRHIESGNHRGHGDSYNCTFLYYNVEGIPKTDIFNDKYIFDNVEYGTYFIFEAPLMRDGYFRIVNRNPDSSAIKFFEKGCCVSDESKPGQSLSDNPELRAKAIARLHESDNRLKYLIIASVLLTICLLNIFYIRLGHCSTILGMIALAVYQFKFTDNAFVPMLTWLIAPIIVYAVRHLIGTTMRTLDSVKRDGGYLVSAEITYEKDSGYVVSLCDIYGKLDVFKNPIVDYSAKKSTNAILMHSLCDNSELKVIAFGTAVTPELFEKFRKPFLIKPGTVVRRDILPDL
ncbi:MAG: hypothetical protein MJZ66_09340 [Bacteroidales bacterium]|nr:hypothetical protein [Bacteroidales bacterium]